MNIPKFNHTFEVSGWDMSVKTLACQEWEKLTRCHKQDTRALKSHLKQECSETNKGKTEKVTQCYNLKMIA